jgi:radical SAM protein with 4Fe4S-binding SPASM domain
MDKISQDYVGVKFLSGSYKVSDKLSSNLILELEREALLSDEDSLIIQEIKDALDGKVNFPFNWSVQEENYLKFNSQEKWLEYLIYRYKFLVYPIRKISSKFPIYLLIEPTSICNLRCTMCFQVDPTFTKKNFMGMMSLELFKEVIDQAFEGGTKAVTIASRGEPTLHKQLGIMLKYASGKFIDLKLNTNGTRLTEALCHDILQSDVNELVFSIDSHEKDVYEKIRVGADFENVLENIRRFHKIRSDCYPASKITTRVSGVKFLPIQNMSKFAEFWTQICDETAYVDIENRWDTYSNKIHPELNSPCNYLWERFYVWYDGTTNPCDVDYKSALSPGNILSSSISDIWNNPHYQKLRQDHLENRRNLRNPCDRCEVKF